MGLLKQLNINTTIILLCQRINQLRKGGGDRDEKKCHRNRSTFPSHLSTICPDKEVEVSVQKMLQSGMDTFAVLEVAIETFHLKDCSLPGDLITRHKKAQGLI